LVFAGQQLTQLILFHAIDKKEDNKHDDEHKVEDILNEYELLVCFFIVDG
jgi:hypothetical protein